MAPRLLQPDPLPQDPRDYQPPAHQADDRQTLRDLLRLVGELRDELHDFRETISGRLATGDAVLSRIPELERAAADREKRLTILETKCAGLFWIASTSGAAALVTLVGGVAMLLKGHP